MTETKTPSGAAVPCISSFDMAVMLRRRKALTRQMRAIMTELGEQRRVLAPIWEAQRAARRKAKQDAHDDKCRRILEARLRGVPWRVICAHEHNCKTVARSWYERACSMVRAGTLSVSNAEHEGKS